MNALRQRSPLPLFGLLVSGVYAAEVLTVRLAFPRTSSPGLLALAVVFDLAVVVPAVYWHLFLRGRQPVAKVAPVLLLSLVGAAAVLPGGIRMLAPLLPYAAALAELLVVGLVARKLAASLRRSTQMPGDAADRIRRAAVEALPFRAVAEAIAFEVSLIYYALFSWRARPVVPQGAEAFTSHRRSGYTALVAALVMVSVVEGIAVHLLVEARSATAAWTITAVGLYGVLWVLGDLQALRLRPTLLERDRLHVRVGLRWAVRADWHDIAELRDVGGETLPEKAPGYLRATVLGKPRLVLELRRPVTAH
ncbi:MAG TPA: hypothetical protein VFE05_16410, partial [Longimicrobiaceae bacterium]|nr:hypothetical protein [Longimicrobiaceae bacterium]